MAKLRHLIFSGLYLAILFNTSLNSIFPLYFLKSIGIDCSGAINFITHRINSSISTMIMKILGIKVYLYQKKDKKLDPKKLQNSIVTIPNHIGELDPFFVGCIFSHMFPRNRRLQVFAKDSVRFYPAIGWFLLATDALFVRYGNKKPKEGGMAYFVKQLIRDSQKDKSILIFPEGSVKRPEIQKSRLAKCKEWGVPEFNNVLIPRVNGLYLIETNVNVETEVFMTIRLKTKGKDDRSIFDMGRFVGGEHPEEVHIMMDSYPVDKKLLEDRDQFDKQFYDRFGEIDKNLDLSLEDWEERYEKTEINPGWGDLGWFTAMLLSTAAPILLYRNPYYWSYLAAGVTFYYWKAFRAL